MVVYCHITFGPAFPLTKGLENGLAFPLTKGLENVWEWSEVWNWSCCSLCLTISLILGQVPDCELWSNNVFIGALKGYMWSWSVQWCLNFGVCACWHTISQCVCRALSLNTVDHRKHRRLYCATLQCVRMHCARIDCVYSAFALYRCDLPEEGEIDYQSFFKSLNRKPVLTWVLKHRLAEMEHLNVQCYCPYSVFVLNFPLTLFLLSSGQSLPISHHGDLTSEQRGRFQQPAAATAKVDSLYTSLEKTNPMPRMLTFSHEKILLWWNNFEFFANRTDNLFEGCSQCLYGTVGATNARNSTACCFEENINFEIWQF